MSKKEVNSLKFAADAVEEMLIRTAKSALTRAYAPYSNFAVGAAVRTTSGAIFPGCNVENASFGLTMCAERVALCAAVSSGEREFSHIVLVAKQDEPLVPCGACRQVLAELAPGAEIIMTNTNGAIRRASVEDLLPAFFKLPHSVTK